MSPKQEQLLIALLTEPTYTAAARKTGVPEATMYRWLTQTDFKDAYRMARRAMVEAGISRLQQTATTAAEALVRGLTCGQTRDELRAADLILSHAIRGTELLDLAERLERLEAVLNPTASTANTLGTSTEEGTDANSVAG